MVPTAAEIRAECNFKGVVTSPPHPPPRTCHVNEDPFMWRLAVKRGLLVYKLTSIWWPVSLQVDIYLMVPEIHTTTFFIEAIIKCRAPPPHHPSSS